MPMKSLTPLLLALAVACAPPAGHGTAGNAADLVLLNGKIVTLEEAHPVVSALAAADGKILALGEDAAMEGLAGDGTRVIDLEGRLAIPGFIEGHGHFTGLGRSLMNIDLMQARSWEEVVERVAQAAAETPPGDWILGWGWSRVTRPTSG